MGEEIRAGYYKDKYGRWQKDRRKGNDRRETGPGAMQREHRRRRVARRQDDRHRTDEDHRHMIDEALEDFAEEHDGHL